MPTSVDSPDWITVQAILNTIGQNSWSNTTALPQTAAFGSSLIYRGYVYLFGGIDNGSPAATVYYAPINANGTIGTWATTTALPAAIYNTSACVYNGFIYIIGGYTGTVSVSTVYYAAVNSNGTIGAWNTTTAMPAVLNAVMSICQDGYIYMLGGTNTTTPVANTYYAAIAADGTIGAWTAGTALPVGNASAGIFTYHNSIYIVGGAGLLPGGVSGAYSSVYSVPITSTGALGTWISLAGLPEPRQATVATIVNGVAYVICGENNAVGSNQLYWTQLNSDGTIGQWNIGNNLPVTNYAHTGGSYNGVLYMLGGQQNGSTSALTWFAQV